MIYVGNCNEPEFFKSWKSTPGNISTEWESFARPDSRHHIVYLNLRKHLIEVQNQMCAYCEIALKIEADSHIEHVKRRADCPNFRYAYQNLLASCQFEDSCGHGKDRAKDSRGKSKIKGWFSGFISPFNPDCLTRFTYTSDGRSGYKT